VQGFCTVIVFELDHEAFVKRLEGGVYATQRSRGHNHRGGAWDRLGLLPRPGTRGSHYRRRRRPLVRGNRSPSPTSRWQVLKHLLATESCQAHSEDAYYGHLVLRLMTSFVLFYTSRVICKGRLTMEEILFSLKHYWRFVDMEPLALQVLS